MNTSRVLILSPSNISTDPRVIRHITVAKEFGEVVTCGYGSLPDDVVEHYEISGDARFLPRSFISLVAIQFGLYGFAARRAQFYREACSALKNQTFDVVIANDVMESHFTSTGQSFLCKNGFISSSDSLMI